MRDRTYDAIVVGASFAGLAVARELRGRILLLDPIHNFFARRWAS